MCGMELSAVALSRLYRAWFVRKQDIQPRSLTRHVSLVCDLEITICLVSVMAHFIYEFCKAL